MRGKWTRRTLEEIRRLRGELARGWVVRVERAADRGRGYLSRVLSGEIQHLDVEILFCLFEHTIVDPRAFLRRLGFDVSSANPLHYLARVKEQGIRDAGLEILEAVVVDVLECSQDDPAGTSGSELGDILRELDELLYSDPAAARQRFNTLIELPDAPRSRAVLVRLLVFYAELCLSEERLGIAARSLRLALRMVTATEHARAEILRVLSRLALRHRWLPAAEDFAREATETCLLANDQPGIGKMLLARALALQGMKEPRRASMYFANSLAYLAADDWCSQASSQLGLGWCHAQLGKWDQARQDLERAKAAHRMKTGPSWIKILRLRGDIAVEQGDLEVAEELLRAVVGLSEHARPLDRTLSILQLARVLFLRRKPHELTRLAHDMLRLLMPLGSNEKASAVVAELITAIEAGKVTLELLDESQRQLEEAP